MNYPNQYQGRLAGYPASPNGKWPFPAKVHPGSLSPASSGIGSPMFSPNDVLSDPNSLHEDSEWDVPLDMNVCRNLKGLTRSQLHICHK